VATILEDDGVPRTRAIWLLLLTEGGRWTVAEVANELGVDTNHVCQYVAQMAGRGFLRRFEGKKLQYAVDKTCRVPMFITMGDIMGAGVNA
jgi:predicted ArsR family transcriptional regulator